MSNIAYTPLNAPQTVTKPGRVLICRRGVSSAKRRWHGFALVALLVLPLAACKRERVPGPDETFGSSVTAMDHDPSDTFVRNVYVDGTWVGEGGRGGKTVLGGIRLPYQWRPGLTAVVKWERCDRFDPKHPVPDAQACRWTEKVVPIHRYDGVWTTWLHLLPNDEVLIIPSDTGPGGERYPGPDFPTKDFFRNTDKDVTP